MAVQTPRRGIFILISDFFDEEETVMEGIQHLRFIGHEVIVFHTLDPYELEFPFNGLVEFHGLEKIPRILTRPAEIRQTYQREFDAFQSRVKEGCEKNGVHYVMVDTSKPLAQIMSNYLSFRMRTLKGKTALTMSFLNTIMLAGVAAVAVPIIIHLLNRRKFKTVTWAAMKFIKLSVDQNQRRMRIEDLILLLIRCALVVLLALALARPASKDAASDVLGQTKVTAFVILDNSYSMDLQGRDGKNAFEEARSAAQETLKALPSGSAVGVLLASDIVQSLIDEPTYDLNQAEQAIKDAKVGHHATDLYPAMEFAVGKTLKPLQTAQPKEVYVITDGQASGWRQNSDIQKLIEDNEGAINFYVLRVGEDGSPDNLAVTKMDISSGLTPINHPLRFEVEVANHGTKETAGRHGRFVCE